jgi:hypothetical protein
MQARSAVDGEPTFDFDAALGRLPARQRAVVALYYVADLPVAEIAALLGVAGGTVKSTCTMPGAPLPPSWRSTMDTDDLIQSRLRERFSPVDLDVAWAELVARRDRRRRRTHLVAAAAGIVLIGGSVTVGLSLRPDDRRATIHTRPAVIAVPDHPESLEGLPSGLTAAALLGPECVQPVRVVVVDGTGQALDAIYLPTSTGPPPSGGDVDVCL